MMVNFSWRTGVPTLETESRKNWALWLAFLQPFQEMEDRHIEVQIFEGSGFRWISACGSHVKH